MEPNQEILIEKLDCFIRKYYQNLLLQGILLFTLLAISFLFTASFFEYFFYFPIWVRTAIVVGALVFTLTLFYRLLCVPLFALVKIGKRISYRQATKIISSHFPHLKDQLINALELCEQLSSGEETDNSLLLASIKQKTDKIKLIPFQNAVSFTSNFRYLKYLASILGLVLCVYFLIPKIYSTSLVRLSNFDTQYEPPANFSFVPNSFTEKVKKGANFTLNIATKGKLIPNEVYILTENAKFLMKEEGDGKFSYLFRQVNSGFSFKLQSGEVRSGEFKIQTILKPEITDFSISIKNPSYTKLPDRVESKLTDLWIPDGSELSWHIKAKNSKAGELNFSDTLSLKPEIWDGNEHSFSKIFRTNNTYRFYLTDSELNRNLHATCRLNVILDAYPTMKLTAIQDAKIPSGYYFRGQIKDDYGFSKLHFVCETENQKAVYTPILLNRNLKLQEFFFSYDFSSHQLAKGSKIKYYFEVFDNDEVNGAKKASSQFFYYHMPSQKQIYELNALVQDSISNKIKEGIELSKSIQKDIFHLQKSTLDGSAETWQKEEIVREIGNKKRQLDDLMKAAKEENRRKNQFMNLSGMNDSKLLEKQKQIEALFDKLMTPELQKRFDDFQSLAQNFKASELNTPGNRLKMALDDFRKQLDRNSHLLERYEIELSLQQLANRIKTLANEQQQQAIRKNIEELKALKTWGKEQWEALKKDLQNVFDNNLSVQEVYKFDKDFQKKSNEIDRSIEELEEHLEQNEHNKSLEKIQNTAQKQHDFAQKLSEKLSKNRVEQLHFERKQILSLLYNVLEFSFFQEDILTELKKIDISNPLYLDILVQQEEMKEKYALIQESLLELSSRSSQIASLIGNRNFEIENELEKAMSELNKNFKGQSLIFQRNVLTGVNEIGGLLSELLQQIMKQNASGIPKMQSGKNKKNASFKDLQSKQHALQRMLQELISEMQSGKVPKDKIGKFLQRQEMYRQNLNEMLQSGELENQSEQILRKMTEMLKQLETDIANMSINPKMKFRQEQIFSNLLKAINAKQEQGFDKERESKTASEFQLRNPKEIFHHKNKKSGFKEVFHDSNLKMTGYYNKLYLEYMLQLND